MRVIGVIDLLGGRAVHARGGRRDAYARVEHAAGCTIAGDAIGLARTYIERLGVAEIYVADLDAIAGRPTQDDLVTGIAALGAPVCLDAGVASAEEARAARARGASTVVVGLETLPALERLDGICAALGGSHVALSLDLRDGQPVACPRVRTGSPESIAVRAARAGVKTVIVLDLARVGMRRGLDADLVARVRRAVPDVALVVGGGIRGDEDLASARDLGCDGALVATALHEGLIHGNVTR
jgi:phosphoribosylformimino-5-aminoimidazole carboxamide ribotide isomerase